MANTIFRIAEVDFEGIKQNLINFLQGQSQFKDYNFKGANFQVLLDLLSFNTHYAGMFANLVGNESFLDSAVLRDSVVSRAKDLTYTPTSRRGAIANVALLVTPPGGNTSGVITLPIYTAFQSEAIDGVNHTFVTTSSITATKNNISNTFSFPSVPLVQGDHSSFSYLVTQQGLLSIYTIPVANVDTTTISVAVQNSTTDTYRTIFQMANDITEITGNSAVYFLQEGPNEQSQIYFGDGYLGKALQNNNIIVVDYLVTDGEAANFANTFTPMNSIYGFSNVQVTTNDMAAGGSEIETIDQIKFRAPIAATAQNRTLNIPDYYSLLLKHYPWIDQVSVWGGEDNVPPVYGQVFISIKPKDGFFVTKTLKSIIISDLELYSTPTIVPVIVDPDYMFLLIQDSFNFDASSTNLSQDQLEVDVEIAIQDYTANNLGGFGSVVRPSRLGTAIDSADSSIVDNSLTLRLQKRFIPTLNVSQNYTISFGVPLHRGGPLDKLASYPPFLASDSSGITQTTFIEETPDSFSGVSSVQILTPGSNYIVNPQVFITGDGFGATGVATLNAGKVSSISITNPGVDYTTAEISIVPDPSDTTGSGATAAPIIDLETGVLRTYTINPSTAEKIIMNANAGIILYNTGQVILSAFNPIQILQNQAYANGVLTLNIQPEEGQPITSVGNQILTLDVNDPLSILVTGTPQ